MEAHALELLHAALWAVITVGGALLALGLYFVRKFVERMDSQDVALNEIRDLLASEIGKLREMQHELDKRIIWIESTCYAQHGIALGGANHHRPKDDNRDS